MDIRWKTRRRSRKDATLLSPFKGRYAALFYILRRKAAPLERQLYNISPGAIINML